MITSARHLTLLLCLLPLTTLPVLERGGKTYYALSQYDTKRCQEVSLWHTHTTTDIGNPLGLSIQLVPFFSSLVRTSSVAKQFTLRETEAIQIASDRFNQKSDAVLPYHAIVHNTSLSAPESSATLNLTPSYVNWGGTLSLFFDAKQTIPGISLAVQLPLFYAKAEMTHGGGNATIGKYFSGTYEQKTPLQAPLAYGLLGSHSYIVYGPLGVTVKYNVLENEQNYITLYTGAGMALQRTPLQKYLFDYYSAVYSHHKFICGLEAGATIAHGDDFSIELIAQTHYHYFFAGKENRILGALDDDGSKPVYSSYLMGAHALTKGVFPLANVLQRSVRRAGMHQVDAACIGAFTYQNWTLNLGYGIMGREEETLTVEEWPSNTYAIVSPLYDTTTFFNDSTASTAEINSHSILLNHRYLTTDMINTSVAASPAQLSISGSASVGCTLAVYSFPVGFGGGISYEHGVTDATPSMLTAWFKAFISF